MKLRYKLLIVVLIIVALVFGYRFERSQQAKKQKIEELAEQYNDVLKKAREEKKTLEGELSLLEEDLYIGNMGSTIILLSDTKSDCLNDTVNKLNSNGYKGVIALDPNYMPDDNIEGYLNRDDINSLLDKGYEVVAKVNNDNIKKIYDLFIDKGYDIKGFYFGDTTINNTSLNTVRSISEDLVTIGKYDSKVKNNSLLIYSYGSRSNNVKTNYSEAIDHSRIIALVVGYGSDSIEYSESNINAMIKLIKSYESNNATKLCNIEETKIRYEEYLEALNEERSETVNRISEINDRLDVLNKAILGQK